MKMRWVALFFFMINSLWDALAASVPSPAFMGAARLKRQGDGPGSCDQTSREKPHQVPGRDPPPAFLPTSPIMKKGKEKKKTKKTKHNSFPLPLNAASSALITAGITRVHHISTSFLKLFIPSPHPNTPASLDIDYDYLTGIILINPPEKKEKKSLTP